MARSGAASKATTQQNKSTEGDTITVQTTRRTTRQQSKEPAEPAASTANTTSPKKRGRKRKNNDDDEDIDEQAAQQVAQEDAAEPVGTNVFQGGSKDARELVKNKLKRVNNKNANDAAPSTQAAAPARRGGRRPRLTDRQANAKRASPIDSSNAIDPELIEQEDSQTAQQLAAANLAMDRARQGGQMNAPTASMTQSQVNAQQPASSGEFVPQGAQGSQVFSSPYEVPPSEGGASSVNPTSASYESYMHVNRIAKFKTQQYRADHEKPPQVRKPWEPQEIDTFITLIRECGPSYSAIKSADADNVLKDRSQGNLKDKARNMKFDYLKSNVALPEGFEKIVLDRKLIDKLREMGINYQQSHVRNVK